MVQAAGKGTVPAVPGQMLLSCHLYHVISLFGVMHACMSCLWTTCDASQGTSPPLGPSQACLYADYTGSIQFLDLGH